MPLRSQLFKTISQGPGSVFTIKKTLTSSGNTTSSQDLTSVATGQLLIEQIVVKTDSTGLAGGTNFEITTNNDKGLENIFVETVANLGGNITKVLSGAAGGDTTTSDAHPTVTAVPTVIEAGKKLQYNTTGAVGTGDGTIDIFVTFRRIDNGAKIVAA